MDKKYYSNLIVSNAPHLVTKMDTKRTMLMVIVALLPSLFVSTYMFGARVLLLSLVGIISAVAFEAIWNALFHKKQTIGDLSAALTGLLLAFNVPVTLPIWILVVGTFVAIIIVKQLFAKGTIKKFQIGQLLIRL